MEMDMTEWGFVPVFENAMPALINPWSAKGEWGMGDPEFDLEADEDGADHVCLRPC